MKTSNTLDVVNKEFSTEVMEARDGERAVIVRMTMSKPDRVGEVVVAEGVDFKRFMENPVVMSFHDYNKLPVGKIAQIKKLPNELTAKILFAPRPEDHVGEWEPDTLFSMYQSGFLKGVSIGFQPVKQRMPSQKDMQLYGPETKLVTYRAELVELSCCSIPMLPEALALAVSKGVITPEVAKNYGYEEKAIHLYAKVDDTGTTMGIEITDEEDDKVSAEKSEGIDDKPEVIEEAKSSTEVQADNSNEEDKKSEHATEDMDKEPEVKEDSKESESNQELQEDGDEENENDNPIKKKKMVHFFVPQSKKTVKDIELMVADKLAKVRGKMYKD